MNCCACNAPLGADAKFCPGCGAAVARAAEPPPVPRELRKRAASFKGCRWVLDEVACG